MVIFQRNIPVISYAYFTNYNEQLINFSLTFVMCVRDFFLSLYDVRWVYIISFGVYTLLYHFRGEHAAKRFIIDRIYQRLDNDTRGEEKNRLPETVVILRLFIALVHEIQCFAIKEFTLKL